MRVEFPSSSLASRPPLAAADGASARVEAIAAAGVVVALSEAARGFLDRRQTARAEIARGPVAAPVAARPPRAAGEIVDVDWEPVHVRRELPPTRIAVLRAEHLGPEDQVRPVSWPGMAEGNGGGIDGIEPARQTRAPERVAQPSSSSFVREIEDELAWLAPDPAPASRASEHTHRAERLMAELVAERSAARGPFDHAHVDGACPFCRRAAARYRSRGATQ